MPNLFDAVYLLALAAGWPWLAWQAVRKGKYREGLCQKLLGLAPRRQGNRRCLWLHAVSVGEVNLLASLLAEIARRRPDWECVVSTTTATGYALARKKYAGLTVFYCPLDLSWAVGCAMRRIRPDLLVLAELELWPNLLRAARRQGARIAIVNGRLSERSFRGYRRLGRLAAGWLAGIDLVAVQNREYQERFLELGARIDSVRVTGSLKFDGAQTDRANPATVRLGKLAGFAPGDFVLVAGSTQEPEEVLLLETFRQLAPRYPQLRLVLVPRHPHRFDAVADLLDRSGLAWRRRSRLEPEVAGSNTENGQSKTGGILLVDAIGELGAWWGTAQAGFVGGSLGSRGGQNMIEPAAYGSAVSFGPNTQNFADVVAALLAQQAAVVVHDGGELTAFVERCLSDASYRKSLGKRAQSFVRSQLGATGRTFELLEPLVIAFLPGGRPRSSRRNEPPEAVAAGRHGAGRAPSPMRPPDPV